MSLQLGEMRMLFPMLGYVMVKKISPVWRNETFIIVVSLYRARDVVMHANSIQEEEMDVKIGLFLTLSYVVK